MYYPLLFTLIFSCMIFCKMSNLAVRIYSGYWIGGFGLGDSIDERPPLLTAVMVRCYRFLKMGAKAPHFSYL